MNTLAEIESNVYEDIVKVSQPEIKTQIIVNYHFCKSAFVEIASNKPGKFRVEFFDGKTLLYSTEITGGQWAKCLLQYYIPYHILVTDLLDDHIVFNETLDLKDKNVVVEFGSKSLGDSLAWLPYVDEFQKKHQCNLCVVTFQNDLFKDQYPNLTFSEPGTSFENIHAWYQLGWYYDKDKPEVIDRFRHPREVKDQPMQKTAADILGLEYKPIRPRLAFDLAQTADSLVKDKYVCIANHSTAQAKYWNNSDGFQGVVNYLKEIGYTVILLSKEEDGYMGNKNPEGVEYPSDYNLDTIMNYINYADFFIGLGSGLTWLAWALYTPVILISGFSEPYTEMGGDGVIRIGAPEGKCSGCFNRYKLNPGLWGWCPDHQEDDRIFECTKSITPAHVISEIKQYLEIHEINENQP